MRVRFLLSEIGIGLRRNLTMTIAVVMTVAVSLLFLGSAWLANRQVELSKQFWYDQIELSIFLCGQDSSAPTCAGGPISPEQRTALERDLRTDPEVDKVFYETKQEAYQHFTEQFRGSALLRTVTPDQLPESFRVKLKDPQHYEVVAGRFSGRPGVENLQDYRKLLDPLFQVLDGLRLGAAVLAGFMLVAAALLIFNTIRLAAYSRRRETGVMRLVGATSLYIQLPFVLEGVIAALVGAGIAFGLLYAGRAVVADWLAEHVHITPYVGTAAVWGTLPVILGVGVGIAAVASFLTLRRYLRV